MRPARVVNLSNPCSFIPFLGVLLVLALCHIPPAHGLIIPPDPFESTDRFVLLNSTPDGTITQAWVKAKAPGPGPLGPGEYWARLIYKLPGNNQFASSQSSRVALQGLSPETSTLIAFDFLNQPVPAAAYNWSLVIYSQGSPETPPLRISEYRSDQLLLAPLSEAFQPPPPPPGGTLIFGPITFLRERESPKTELVSFTVSDATGPFLLRLTNGTSEGAQRVSSSFVKLNGSEVFGPPQFNQRVSSLSRQVTLPPGENSLEVMLRSAPGSFVTIELFRLVQNACPVLGLHTFIRSTGQPVEETVSFDQPSQFAGPFVMNVTSGNPDGSNRVDSAAVELNSMIIFDPDDFNEQPGFLSEIVSLLPTNTLNVQISGAPGDLLTLEIVGYDSTPPSVTITGPSDGAVFSTGPITVSGTVNDPSASVTVNGITVSVGSDGTFTVDGITLVEGENTIKAVAVDGCGNQGEDEVLVYLSTAPQGPLLVFCAMKIEPMLMGMEDEDCKQQVYVWNAGSVYGMTDDTAVSVTINGVLLPDGVEVNYQGDILWGVREGPYFYADVMYPWVDGTYPFTAVVTDAEGAQTEATVTLIRDMTPPNLIITSPPEGLVTNSPTITITGTVDDPEAIVIDGYGMEIPVVNGTFTTQVTLEEGPWNYIWFGALDPAGNFEDIEVQIILDTIPPQLNVTNPTDGKAVNTPTLTVTGSIIDPNKDTVTVEVNNGPPQALSLSGSNFSGTVTLSPNLNSLIFHAADKAGNSSTLSRSVLLDLELPAVSVIVPQPDAIISGVATVSVEAGDAMSGITSVKLYVDGQLKSTLTQPPFDFVLDTSPLTSGLHTITVKATDKAGNVSEASVNVTIDNEAPVVLITSPASGAFATGTITVSVEANDALSGMASVSLYLDGQLQSTITQPPFNFLLDTLPFASGGHTLTARGVDNKGNQAETSIIVSFDHVPPIVSITAPASGSTVSGIVTVTAEATDSLSGVASVAFYINTQLHSTLNQPPFNFSVDTSGYVPGSYTVTARAADQAGNQAEATITLQVSAFGVKIISPVDGSTVNKTAALVQGKLYNSTGEVGVVINGALAEVQGGDFAAIVPLEVGQNILKAVATTADGFQVQTSVTVNAASQQEMIRLTVYPNSGILIQPANTLDVTFEAEAYLPNPVSSYSWDFNGDGTPEASGTYSTVAALYQYPGLYFPRVTVLDTQGNAYTETTVINVLSREEMDGLLRSKWEGMKAALTNQNADGALDYFAEESRQLYGELFGALYAQLPQIVQDMQDIHLIYLKNGAAKYRIRKNELYGGQSLNVTYYIYFAIDQDGIWRIFKF